MVTVDVPDGVTGGGVVLICGALPLEHPPATNPDNNTMTVNAARRAALVSRERLRMPASDANGRRNAAKIPATTGFILNLCNG